MNFVKRFFDIVISFLALIILIIPFIIIGIISLCKQGRPVIIKQKRYGRYGKIFNIYKFRTMYKDTPTMASNDVSEANITRWGRILRKSSIDELPQLFNVLIGEMSIIGPRPLIIEEEEAHQLRLEKGVYKVKPGITGWAQINGRDNIDTEEKIELDKYYVENRSFAFDMKILLRSFSAVATGKDIKK